MALEMLTRTKEGWIFMGTGVICMGLIYIGGRELISDMDWVLPEKDIQVFPLEPNAPETNPIPLEEPGGEFMGFPLSILDGLVLDTPLTEAQIDQFIFVYPIDQETGLILLEARGNFEFTAQTKAIAWENSLRRGEVGENDSPREFVFHHKVPAAYAKKLGLDANIIKSAANCLVMSKEDHIQLHREYTIEELGKMAIEQLPLQLNLFGKEE